MSREYEVVTRASVGCDEWDQFAGQTDEAWLWHLYELQGAMDTWPDQRDMAFAVRRAQDGVIRAIVPLQLKTRRWKWLFRARSLESLGGAAMAADLSRGERRAVWRVVRDHLDSVADKHRASAIKVTLSTLAPAFRGDSCPRANPLVEAGFVSLVSQTWLVDLRVSQEQLWDGLEGRARTAVRKAERIGVQVRPAQPCDADLDMYYQLHCETYRRTGAVPHPREYFAHIWHNCLAAGRARVLFAEVDGGVVAAHNCGHYKAGAFYWTGAASQAGLSLGANSLLQWTAMKQVQEAGCEWYDTGEAFPAASDGKKRGLNDFKRSFGGELYPLFRGAAIRKPLSLYLLYEVYKQYVQ